MMEGGAMGGADAGANGPLFQGVNIAIIPSEELDPAEADEVSVTCTRI